MKRTIPTQLIERNAMLLRNLRFLCAYVALPGILPGAIVSVVPATEHIAFDVSDEVQDRLP